jgi:hypothetical protein
VKFGAGTAQARTITFALGAFNLLNRANDVNYVGTLGLPLFGEPVAALARVSCRCPRGSSSERAIPNF